MCSRLVACCAFLLLLLLLLPLQMGWAGMSAPAAQPGAHAGVSMAAPHCRHAVPADSATAGTSLAQTPEQADPGHCGSCHGAIALLAAAPSRFAGAPFAPAPGTLRLPASQPAELPDRPQWSARG